MRVKGLPVSTVEDKLEAPSLCASEGAFLFIADDTMEAPSFCASERAICFCRRGYQAWNSKH